MKAIIVPGVTDLNKGDQALVWESWRLVKDTSLYEEICILESGDTPEERKQLCQQTEEKGLKLIHNILPHPRRGKHDNKKHVKDSSLDYLRLVRNAIDDFFYTKKILKYCNDLDRLKTKLPSDVYGTVKEFKDADAVFVKGGGFIHAYGELSAPYLMWYFLFYVRLAKKMNKKVIFLPNSFGPFNGITVKKQVQNVLGDIDLVYAREQVSQRSLSDLLNKEVKLEMDLGFFLEKGSEEKALEVLKRYNFSDKDKIVGITIRPWRFPGHASPEDLYDNYIMAVSELCKHLIKKKYKIALCNQSLGPNSHEDDRNAIRDLLEIVKDKNVIWIDENLTCDVLKTIYGHFKFFVGTRFHSIIFSLTSLVPSIAIGYGGNKAKGIMSDFDLDEYVVQIQDINSQLLIEKFDKAESNYLEILKKLKSSMGLVTESRKRIISDIQKLYVE